MLPVEGYDAAPAILAPGRPSQLYGDLKALVRGVAGQHPPAFI